MSQGPDRGAQPCVVLGVSGGIAAYKAAELCRRLVERGARVVPVMTRSATRFLGPATLSALASEPVRTSLFDDADPIPHTRLAREADLVLVAPATARLIGSYAAGISADLLTATLLATRAPVVLCPAMHAEMWEHPAVQDNVARLCARGVRLVGPAEGRLAGGDFGVGRLADPEEILAAVDQALARPDMSGLKVLVTAGGTREPIDPVRFIGNRSSGKQGHAIAEEAAARGAAVTLVTTTALGASPSIAVHRVESASEMHEVVSGLAPSQDVVVMAAAVADFRPARASPTKIPKSEGVPQLELEPTPDILATLGASKPSSQLLVGFAAETGQVLERARSKLAAKGLDLIVANDVASPGVGFEHDTNAVVMISADGHQRQVPLAGKRQVAASVLDEVVRQLARRRA
ncbi:MAG TPA: bifunctional phosphopantothenoylcysteine decarboxylase/phosphopantothenate--cysteine ligase CoaBC [Acidimicrobiales bacterium]|nr:bifunctional phosphopantothenoylcysteine decarboxylase/phosphopantothenate--cysteine ligase CoaBC [Acidimicrobiales bacterium]